MAEDTVTFALPNNSHLTIKLGDITLEKKDAIVNAANAYLLHGGGVAGAIVRRGGITIQTESDAWVKTHGPISHSHPAWTKAGDLPCQFIIHAVGPVWGEGEEERKLTMAIFGSLKLADDLKLSSIAFPAISTGIFGFPKDRSAQIFSEAILSYFQNNSNTSLHEVAIVLIDNETFQVFCQAMSTTLPPVDKVFH